MPIDGLHGEREFADRYTAFARTKVEEVKRRLLVADAAALPIAHRRWMIERQIMQARLEPSETGQQQVKTLSHLKELAALLPCLASVPAFHCPYLSYDTSMLATSDTEMKRRFDYLGAVPNAYLAWEFCFSLLELYEVARSKPGGDRSEPFEPSITFDLYDDIIRGLASGLLDPVGSFYLFKALAARG